MIKDLKEALRSGNMNKSWQQFNNPDIKPIEFDRLKKEAGAKNNALNLENMYAELVKQAFHRVNRL